MSKTLAERLRDAKSTLDQMHAAVGRHPGSLPPEVDEAVCRVIDHRNDMGHWIGLLEARAVALQLLDGLETKVDVDDRVPLGTVLVRYQHARFVGVAAYLAANWALADRITGLVGRVLCTPQVGRNEISAARLVDHFVRDERKRTTAAALFDSVQQTFGWPIGLSYAIRNHFLHDGAQFRGCDFFDGPTAASAFRVSTDGWGRVESQAESYGINRACHRTGAGWPTAPRDDLRVVLKVCEREMDDALGVLVGSACHSLSAHVGFMVGED